MLRSNAASHHRLHHPTQSHMLSAATGVNFTSTRRQCALSLSPNMGHALPRTQYAAVLVDHVSAVDYEGLLNIF